MKTTVSQEGPTKVRISVEATPDEVAPAVDRAFERLAGEVKVPGFRQGKVPRKVLEARLGADQIRDASLQEAVPLLWRQAMTESDVSPISLPDIEVRSYDDQGLSFDALFEV
ncbi:MAG: trigger factor family protein, partial [Actinomycetota bacterium]